MCSFSSLRLVVAKTIVMKEKSTFLVQIGINVQYLAKTIFLRQFNDTKQKLTFFRANLHKCALLVKTIFLRQFKGTKQKLTFLVQISLTVQFQV